MAGLRSFGLCGDEGSVCAKVGSVAVITYMPKLQAKGINVSSRGRLSDEYPPDLAAKMAQGYVDMREAGESLYARALEVGATDPKDPNLELKIFGHWLEMGIGNAMARGALLRRLKLAREGFPECYWVRDAGEAGEAKD